MKRLIAIVLSIALVCAFVPAAFASETSGRAYPSTQKVDVDGKAVEFQCYALKDAAGNDTNYIKLRDLAEILNGSTAQFEVGWDGAVNIETGKAYTKNGSEMSTPFSGERTYEAATAPTNINGAAANLDAIVLKDDGGNGYTYYKLRDLGTALGIKVDWSAEKGIFIETKEKEVPNVTVFSKDSDKTLTVPVTSVKEYINQGWSTLPREVTIDENYFQTYGEDDLAVEDSATMTYSNMFSGGLKTITWEYGDGCLVVGGDHTFGRGNIYLDSATNPPEYGGAEKYNITKIFIKEGVNCDSASFSVFTGLRQVELPNSMKSLEGNTLDNSRLTRVGVPSSVTFISERAFGDYTVEYVEDEETGKRTREYRLNNRSLTIYCEPGSEASDFAQKYNVRQVAATQVFYPDGRTCMVSAREKKDYLKKGWCEEPVTLMYNADGEVKAVAVDEVSHQTGWYQSTGDFSVLYDDAGTAKIVGKNEIVALKQQSWYDREDITQTIYTGKGETLTVLKSTVPAYEQSGWYASIDKAQVTLYAPDGRTRETWVDEVEDYLKVGWYANKGDLYITMYAPDGRSKEVAKGQVEANKAVGWYEKPVTTLYASGGKKLTVYTDEVDTYKKQGWTTNKSEAYAYLAGLDFRRIKSSYSNATALCGYAQAFTNAKGEECVMTVVWYKIITNFHEVTLHNLTTGERMIEPSTEYDKLISRAYGASKLGLYDLQQEVLTVQVEMGEALSNILETGKNTGKGAYVDAATLNSAVLP